jgi:dTDP-glucose 4,6-dehydratase
VKILVTGGCGFIGSNFIRRLLTTRGEAVSIVNLDKLTYAANPASLADVEGRRNYRFIKGDIADPEAARAAMDGCTHVVNFAAETHVDRSLLGDASFIETDVRGVFVLLEEARRRGIRKFIQISTDEVYGSIAEGSFTEDSALHPRNPYAASKAGGDRLAYSYWASYAMPVVVTRASNNYGPYQHPEKLIPLFITNAIEGLPLRCTATGRTCATGSPSKTTCRRSSFSWMRARPAKPTTLPAVTRPRTSKSRGRSSRVSAARKA